MEIKIGEEFYIKLEPWGLSGPHLCQDVLIVKTGGKSNRVLRYTEGEVILSVDADRCVKVD